MAVPPREVLDMVCRGPRKEGSEDTAPAVRRNELRGSWGQGFLAKDYQLNPSVTDVSRTRSFRWLARRYFLRNAWLLPTPSSFGQVTGVISSLWWRITPTPATQECEAPFPPVTGFLRAALVGHRGRSPLLVAAFTAVRGAQE